MDDRDPAGTLLSCACCGMWQRENVGNFDRLPMSDLEVLVSILPSVTLTNHQRSCSLQCMITPAQKQRADQNEAAAHLRRSMRKSTATHSPAEGSQPTLPITQQAAEKPCLAKSVRQRAEMSKATIQPPVILSITPTHWQFKLTPAQTYFNLLQHKPDT